MIKRNILNKIAKSFFDQTDYNENLYIEKWINKKRINKKLFNQLQTINNILSNYTPFVPANTESAWEKVKNRIQTNSNLNKTSEADLKNKKIIYSIAATLLIIIGLFFLFKNINKDLITIKTQNNNEKILLPDSSTIYLSTYSKITYNKKFNNRTVSFQGKAFFEIKHQNNVAFIVNTKDINIKVLGTSFMINTKNQNQSEVYVESGKIFLSTKKSDKQNLLLKEGYIGIISNNRIDTSLNKNKNIIAWKTKRMLFENNDLKHVINVIEEVYNIKIEIKNPEIENCRFTSTGYIENKPLEKVLEIIATALNLKVEENKKKIIISGNGCY